MCTLVVGLALYPTPSYFAEAENRLGMNDGIQEHGDLIAQS
jgi:hypothetical protein